MRYVSLHTHFTFDEVHKCNDLCKVEYCGVGRPPLPWCERFSDKILYVSTCWIWRNVIDRKDSERNRLNFSVNVRGIKRCIDACRWIYIQTIGEIPFEFEIDHLCEDWR